MPSASWRARQRPMANRRSRWRRSVSTGVANPSDAPAGMQRGDAEAEVAVLHIAEAGRADHRREAFLVGKAADALHEIAVGLLVLRHQSADLRQDVEAVEVVGLRQRRIAHFREFQAQKAPARLQHAIRFAQRDVDMGDIADAKGNRIGIDRAVGQGQRLGIHACPVEPGQPALVDGAVAALLQHGGIDIGDQHKSEEHTSELQSLMRISYAVFCLKKKKTKKQSYTKYKTDNHETNNTTYTAYFDNNSQ